MGLILFSQILQELIGFGKSFCKTIFQVWMDLKKYRNKAEMKERKKSTLLRNSDRKQRQEDYLQLMQQV